MKQHNTARLNTLNFFSKIFKISLITSLLSFTFLLSNAPPKSGKKSAYKITIQNRLIGNFDPAKNKDFKLVPKGYDTKKTYLQYQALDAFLRMARAAARDGIKLKIVSGFRSFQHQGRIWNRKFKKFSTTYQTVDERVNAILQYSSYPGTSRHHWGTDIDINSLSNFYFTQTTRGKKVRAWLDQHANKYGFFLTYTPSFQRTGYRTELWHYTYYPVSSKIMHDYLTYITPSTIQIPGKQTSVNFKKIFKDYVLGINPTILKKMNLDGLLIELDY